MDRMRTKNQQTTDGLGDWSIRVTNIVSGTEPCKVRNIIGKGSGRETNREGRPGKGRSYPLKVSNKFRVELNEATPREGIVRDQSAREGS